MTASVSVIVPFFDELEYVDDAVSSIFAQRLPGVEVIVVDDNPAQNHSDILNDFAEHDGFKIVRHSENLGLSAARNTGLSHASGEWIAFLDADDYYLQDGLTSQIEMARATDADMTHAQAMRSAFGTPDATVIRWDRNLHAKHRHGGGIAEFPEAQFIASSWSSLYRRDFLERADLQFDPEQRQFEDRLFVLEAVTRAQSLAFLGQPNRIWRGRQGSVSVKTTDTRTRQLQLMLLEKCLSVAETAVAEKRVTDSVLHRESANTLWRLIWDLDLLDVVAQGSSEESDALKARLTALMRRLVLPMPAERDAVLRKVSRIGHTSRRGTIGADAYGQIVRNLVACRFEKAFEIIDASGPASPRVQTKLGAQKQLVLHVGLHKTGSTYLQQRLFACRNALKNQGILVPLTGVETDTDAHIRPDAHSGHSGLFRAIRGERLGVFEDLQREIAASPCDTVLMSCENMLFPYLHERQEALDALFAQLGGFREVQVVAFARRPDVWLDAYYREWVLNGARGGARGFASFARDYGPLLLNWPELFTPFEGMSGRPIRLLDYDMHAKVGTLWQGFGELCGLALPDPDASATRDKRLYPTPNRVDVSVGELIAALEPYTDRRIQLLKGYFAQGDVTPDEQAMSSPEARKAQLEMFEAQSGAFARTRGYAFDTREWYADLAAETWTPPGGIDASALQRLARAGLSLPPEANMQSTQSGPRLRPKLKPWAAELVDQVKSILPGRGNR